LIHHIDVTITSNENEAVLLECNLIKQHRPRFNILLRDDKSYPYIVISKHEFPRIDSYRGSKKSNGRYFGPYPSAVAVRETINLIQKIFKLRTCRDSFLQHVLGLVYFIKLVDVEDLVLISFPKKLMQKMLNLLFYF